MLSRVAENLYWLGRDIERAENMARMAEVTYHSSVEQHTDGDQELETWSALLHSLGQHEAYEEALEEDPNLQPGDYLILSTRNPNSLRSIVTRARGRARELREHVSREVFEEINLLYLTTSRVGTVHSGGMRSFSASVKRTVAAIIGLFDNTVLLTEGRDWFRCGLFIERADMTSRIVDTKYYILLPTAEDVGGPLDRFQWLGVLRSASASEAFRKRYRTSISGPRVANLLIFDESFPRSLVFSTQALQRHFERAAAETPPSQRVHIERELMLLLLELGATDVQTVIRAGLHEFIDDFQARLSRVDEAMGEYVFHALPEAVA